jgi:5-oxoprolinase (ATP-hydrolysing) subunit A
MKVLKINADVGEGAGNDAQIILFMDYANIACGYHAGDEVSIRQTLELCIKHNVKAGAHPSYYDKTNFGRTEKNLSQQEIYHLVQDQLIIFTDIAKQYNLPLHHVKPHGALYNQSAKNLEIAATIAKAVYDFDKNTILFGLSGSHSITEAKKIGLKTISEVFADRTYQDDGSLTPRSMTGAMNETAESVVKQVSEFREGFVTTVSGKRVSLEVDTVCVHGDGVHAVEFAKAIHSLLKS